MKKSKSKNIEVHCQAPGAKGFGADYWKKNYSEPESMDGIGNARAHAFYLKSIMELDQIDVSSIIDFGFGHGELFKAIMAEFIPYRAYGIEPSEYIFNQASAENLRPVASTGLKLECIDLFSWAERCRSQKRPRWYDLGVCTSVFQYLTDEELEFVVPIMAKQVRYLYLTVPTDKELDRQIEELNFHDTFAIRRTRKFYHKLLGKSFTFISSRVLESRHHFDEQTSSFTDLLYRF